MYEIIGTTGMPIQPDVPEPEIHFWANHVVPGELAGRDVYREFINTTSSRRFTVKVA